MFRKKKNVFLLCMEEDELRGIVESEREETSQYYTKFKIKELKDIRIIL